MARDQKMNRRRELGKTYSYKPNPFSEGTREYYEEQLKSWEEYITQNTNFRVEECDGKIELSIGEGKRRKSKDGKKVDKWGLD